LRRRRRRWLRVTQLEWVRGMRILRATLIAKDGAKDVEDKNSPF
jgi:hypothetical protein